MLLDTCALLWLAEGGGKLSRKTLREIQNAPELCVSSISGFEITLKEANGKLQLPAAVPVWFETVLNNHGLTVLAPDLPVCIKAGQLPAIHFDPFDRLIIATALVHDFPVITTDERFAAYGVETMF
jgi:PIN domain nuclease of toxin-antitoxin system